MTTQQDQVGSFMESTRTHKKLTSSILLSFHRDCFGVLFLGATDP